MTVCTFEAMGGARVCCIFLQHKINRNSSKFCWLVSGRVWNASHTHTQSPRQAIYYIYEYEFECEYPFLRHNKMEFIFKQLPLARLLCQRKSLANQKSLNSTRLANGQASHKKTASERERGRDVGIKRALCVQSLCPLHYAMYGPFHK